MKLGEKITHNGVELQLVKHDNQMCRSCYFFNLRCPVDLRQSDYPLCNSEESGKFIKLEEETRNE